MTQKRARSQEAIEQRYQDILSAARKLFLVQSYDQISLVSLAKQLDISRPSFYPKLFIANKKTSRILSTAEILEVFDLHLLGDIFDWTKKGFPFMI